MADAPTTQLAPNPRFEAAAQPAIAKLIGFRLTAFGSGEATVELDSSPQHYNPMGTVHGGVLCDIADAAMGMAFASTLEADQSFTTLELKIKFSPPGVGGELASQSAGHLTWEDGRASRMRCHRCEWTADGAGIQHLPGAQRQNCGGTLGITPQVQDANGISGANRTKASSFLLSHHLGFGKCNAGPEGNNTD